MARTFLMELDRLIRFKIECIDGHRWGTPTKAMERYGSSGGGHHDTQLLAYPKWYCDKASHGYLSSHLTRGLFTKAITC